MTPRRALAQAAALCRENPNSAHAHLLRAQALLDLGRQRRARDAAWVALRLAPAWPEVYRVAGRTELRCGRPAAAEAAFRAGLRLSPHDEGLANDLGIALGAQGRHEEAFAMFSSVAASAPADPTAPANAVRTLFSLALWVGLVALFVGVVGVSVLTESGHGYLAFAYAAGVTALAGCFVALRLPPNVDAYVRRRVHLAIPSRRYAVGWAAVAVAWVVAAVEASRIEAFDGVASALVIETGVAALVLRWIARRPPRPLPPEREPAPLAARLTALGTDAMVVFMATVPLTAPLRDRSAPTVAYWVVAAVVAVAYSAVADGRGGVARSDSAVVDARTGEHLGLGRGLLRSLVKVALLPLAPLSLLLLRCTARRRALHDLVARSAVLRRPGQA